MIGKSCAGFLAGTSLIILATALISYGLVILLRRENATAQKQHLHNQQLAIYRFMPQVKELLTSAPTERYKTIWRTTQRGTTMSAHDKEPEKCPKGWQLLLGYRECLRIFSLTTASPDQVSRARNLCAAHNASLIRVDSQEKTTAMIQQFPKQAFSCFPDMMKRQEVWVFSDGTPVTWFNWRKYPQEPTNTGSCLSLLWYAGGVWNDVPCTISCGHDLYCSQTARH